MTLVQANKLAGNVKDTYLKDVYSVISKSAKESSIAGDEEPSLVLPSSVCDEITNLGFERVKANYIERGLQFESLEEARKKVLVSIAGDTLINQKTGVGTFLDPAVYTHSQIPVMLGPWEGSALYAPGGLPATIIDKKARAMVMHGATFKSENKEVWDSTKIEQMEQAAAITGFNDSISDASADSFIYGGSILYPVFKKDSPSSYKRKLEHMHLEKGCIDRWVNTDRWNTVVVPSYIVTAKDYLRPDTIYIPQSALEISTTRIAMIKPKPVPYWISLYNIGWAPSDMSGWIRSYYGYEITCQSIPQIGRAHV